MRRASSGPSELDGRLRAGRARSLRGAIAGAVSLLTIIPVPAGWASPEVTAPSSSAAWLPLVGGLIGAAAGGVDLLAAALLGQTSGIALAMASLVVLSGGLHQDALADFADGLGVRSGRERRLEVMRDSTLGTFGVLALVGWSLLLFAVLTSMTRGHVLRALIVACAVGRLAALAHATVAPPARRDGLGASFTVSPLASLVAATISAAIAIGLLGAWRGGLALVISLVVGTVSALWARSKLGGRTGDTLGTAVALTELAVCLGLLASWR